MKPVILVRPGPGFNPNIPLNKAGARIDPKMNFKSSELQ
jgi:hypothetical protein